MRRCLFGFTSRMSSHLSYINLDAQKEMKHCHPAAERNKDPILQTLKPYIKASNPSYLLEISSGSGQHVAHISPNFPNVTFQPTEVDKSSLRSIAEYVSENTSGNIKQPKLLDVRTPSDTWLDGTLKKESVDYMLNINMMHISEWSCTEGLFKGCKYLLKPGGLLFTYGPYADNGVITPESNIRFDASLRGQDPGWGLRDITLQLAPLAEKAGLSLTNKYDLPANNKLIVWKKI